MTKAEVQEIRERAAKATYKTGIYSHASGEYFKYVGNEQVFVPAFDVEGLNTLGNFECGAMEENNAQFIAHARVDVTDLCDQLEKAITALNELHGACGCKSKDCPYAKILREWSGGESHV